MRVLQGDRVEGGISHEERRACCKVLMLFPGRI
jgi:hypothetical protein